MPAYTYRCRHCAHIETLTQGFHDAFPPPCPACGGLTERIITSAPMVISPLPDAPPPAEPEHQCTSACALHRPLARYEENAGSPSA